MESLKIVGDNFVACFNFTGLWGCNLVYYFVHTKEKWLVNEFMENVNSWVRGTLELHKNWTTTTSNDSTVYMLQLCFISCENPYCNCNLCESFLWGKIDCVKFCRFNWFLHIYTYWILKFLWVHFSLFS